MDEIRNGSVIKFRYKDTEMQGVLVSTTGGKYNIKLVNGYNLSIPHESFEVAEVVSHIDEIRHEMEEQARAPSGKRKVAVIGTGGTIASRVDYITGAVSPVLNPGLLRESIPNLGNFTLDINLLEAVLSENFTPESWKGMARTAAKMLEKNEGAVILHGTDTMSYSAAALSFMLEKQTGPVIFVGSQRSSDRPSSDAFLNLEASLEFASSRFGEVGIAMHENTSDSRVALHRAVRSRKMHTSRRDAFTSVGIAPTGHYEGGKVHLEKGFKPRDEETVLKDSLEENVALIYFHPGLRAEDFQSMIDGKRAAVVMGTGLGHVGERFYPAIGQMISDGGHLMMTSQCLFGSVNMNVYSTGRELLSLGVLPLGNMLPEVAMIKSMFVLANYSDEDFGRIMLTDLRGELPDREMFREDA